MQRVRYLDNVELSTIINIRESEALHLQLAACSMDTTVGIEYLFIAVCRLLCAYVYHIPLSCYYPEYISDIQRCSF